MESLKKKLGAAVLGGSLLIGGAAGAYALTGAAGAQDSTSTTAATATTDSSTNGQAPSGDQPSQAPSGDQQGQQGQQGQPPSGAQAPGPHTANGKTETLLTGSDLEKATAAAKAKVSDATVDRAETDADGDAYEVHMTKSDGTHITVKLDESFAVTGTEDGPGAGQGPGGHGPGQGTPPQGAPQGAPQDGNASSSSSSTTGN